MQCSIVQCCNTKEEVVLKDYDRLKKNVEKTVCSSNFSFCKRVIVMSKDVISRNIDAACPYRIFGTPYGKKISSEGTLLKIRTAISFIATLKASLMAG